MTDLRDPADGIPTSPAGTPPVSDPRAMPPWLPRAIGLCLLGVAGLFVVWWLLLRLRTLLSLLVVSLFLAIAIEPAVNALARRGWRRGVATAATVAVAGWALADLGLHRLELRHSTANPASCRVAAKAGFALEGTLRSAMRHPDGWHDMHLHGLVPGDG